MSDIEFESPASPVEKKKRTPNAWVKHILADQIKHKVPYKTAMRDSKKSYHKAKAKALKKSKRKTK
jgi:hypothetical protein